MTHANIAPPRNKAPLARRFKILIAVAAQNRQIHILNKKLTAREHQKYGDVNFYGKTSQKNIEYRIPK